MATSIAFDVYNFSTGMEFAQKYTHIVPVAKIVSVDDASIYNFKGVYFTGVRSKITEDWGGVIKQHYAAQTPAQIQTLINA